MSLSPPPRACVAALPSGSFGCILMPTTLLHGVGRFPLNNELQSASPVVHSGRRGVQHQVQTSTVSAMIVAYIALAALFLATLHSMSLTARLYMYYRGLKLLDKRDRAKRR